MDKNTLFKIPETYQSRI